MSPPALAPTPTDRPSSETLLSIWMEYRATGDKCHRDRLVLSLAPMVKHIAGRKAREVPPSCELEDFISCGLEALIGAVDRYEPLKGATLEQFAWTRVHGAILDELRRRDWAPRGVRQAQRQMETVSNEFAAIHGREPTPQELSEALAMPVAEILRRREDIYRAEVGSLNTVVASAESDVLERQDTVVSQDLGSDPEHQAAKSDAKRRFREAFKGLTRREREIAVLLYVKGMTAAEVGRVYGVTESRISQIHTALRRKLRSQLSEHGELFAEAA
jgi:RNA polymerase sigma factor for flagellar operon FliA